METSVPPAEHHLKGPGISTRVSSTGSAHRYHPSVDSGGEKMNTRCPPKRVPSAARFVTLCRLTVQPSQSYSAGGQRSSGQLTCKPAGARPDYRGRWCAGLSISPPGTTAPPLIPLLDRWLKGCVKATTHGEVPGLSTAEPVFPPCSAQSRSTTLAPPQAACSAHAITPAPPEASESDHRPPATEVYMSELQRKKKLCQP
ncbi:UNVERIFIED_CONTAM: hypothetical protein FKN15_045622 [Acipenser sinensis]